MEQEIERTAEDWLKILVMRTTRFVDIVSINSPKIMIQTEIGLIRKALDELELRLGASEETNN